MQTQLSSSRSIRSAWAWLVIAAAAFGGTIQGFSQETVIYSQGFEADNGG